MNTSFITDTVISKDGTAIAYRKLGKGPGLVLLHGAMESAASHMGLAENLAKEYTVYLPERRGHDMEAAKAHVYGMKQELEDLKALLVKTDSHFVFGVSAGGMIALEAARVLKEVQRVVLYEPALVINDAISMDFLKEYKEQLDRGAIGAAMVTVMIGAKLGPGFMNAMPRSWLDGLTDMTIRKEDRTAKQGDVTMRMLAPTIYNDFVLVGEMRDTLERYKGVTIPVLILTGGRSPKWLRNSADLLATTIPGATIIRYKKLDHGGSSDISATNRSGKPAAVAPDIADFLAQV